MLARKQKPKQAQTVPVIIVLFTSTHRREKNTQTAVDGLQIRDCYYLNQELYVESKHKLCHEYPKRK